MPGRATGACSPTWSARGEPVGALGGLSASALNQNVTAWRSAPAAVAIERTVVGWLAQAVACGGSAGSLTSGRSALGSGQGVAADRQASDLRHVPMTAKPLAGLDAKPSDPGLEQNSLVTH
jgi:hypothetical protein